MGVVVATLEYQNMHFTPQGEWGYMFKEVSSGERGAVFGTTINHLMRRFRFPRIDFAKVRVAKGIAMTYTSTMTYLSHTSIPLTD